MAHMIVVAVSRPLTAPVNGCETNGERRRAVYKDGLRRHGRLPCRTVPSSRFYGDGAEPYPETAISAINGEAFNNSGPARCYNIGLERFCPVHTLLERCRPGPIIMPFSSDEDYPLANRCPEDVRERSSERTIWTTNAGQGEV